MKDTTTEAKQIFTIGHSTRPFDDFVTMLLSCGITVVADVRVFPGSRWFPQFNRERMRTALAQQGIDYEHFKELGGRKDTGAETDKRGKQHAAFSAYAQYMKTETYAAATGQLEDLASRKRVAFMCAEADWRKCHRSLMSDDLTRKGWDVRHITGVEQTEPHIFTAYAESTRLFKG